VQAVDLEDMHAAVFRGCSLFTFSAHDALGGCSLFTFFYILHDALGGFSLFTFFLCVWVV
jgi:hypothetical protein